MDVAAASWIRTGAEISGKTELNYEIVGGMGVVETMGCVWRELL